MAEKLTNITAPQYRCSVAGCPAVYRDRTPEAHRCPVGECPAVLDDEAGNFVFIGEKLDPLHEEGLAGKVSHTEAAVKLSADLVLSSLGIAALIEAAEPIVEALDHIEKFLGHPLRDGDQVDVSAHLVFALREALSSIKGGK